MGNGCSKSPEEMSPKPAPPRAAPAAPAAPAPTAQPQKEVPSVPDHASSCETLSTEGERRRSSLGNPAVLDKLKGGANKGGEQNESPEDVMLGEFFQYGDFSIVVQNNNRRGSVIANPKRKPALQKQKAGEEGESFRFGDFIIPIGSLDDSHFPGTGNEPKDYEEEIPPVQEISGERQILDYNEYNLLGHATRVKCVSLSPSEKYYVSCSNEDAVIVMYDIHSGKEILSFFGHDDTIISTSFSSDSKFLATTSRDNSMILWDAVIGQQISVFDHEKVVICCCFSRDGKFLVSGCQDKVCRKWDIRKRREVLAYSDHDGIIVSVSYSPDGDCICSAAADRVLRVWNSVTGRTEKILKGHKGIVLACTYSADGRFIVSNDETVMKIWNLVDGSCCLNLDVHSVPHPASWGYKNTANKKLAWTLCTYAPGEFGYYVVAVCNDRIVYVFDPETGEEIVSFYSHAPVYCLSSGQHAKLAYGDSFGNIYVVVLS